MEKRNETKQRLATQRALNTINQYREEMKENLNWTIQNINERLSQQNAQKTGTSITSAEEKADAMMKELIEEEEKQKKAKIHRNKKNTIKSKNQAKSKGTREVKNQVSKKKPDNSPTTRLKNENVKKVDPVRKKEIQVSKFASKLSSFKCSEHPRIRRWQTTDIESIRHFVDNNPEGETIFRYQDLSDVEILEQRARHFLPGTERVLKNHSYRSIYTFPTDRGYGVVAQLDYNH